MTERAETPGTDPAQFRVHVASQAIRLFSAHGYEATTVDQIAAAAGVSRRTFFRQFRSKEDVIFADHESLLAQVQEFLTADAPDPWARVCDAAGLVFDRFRHNRDLSMRRYRVVQHVPALRDRELVTGFRYERLFVDYLRSAAPRDPVLRVVGFAAAVTACHNYVLRSMIKGDADATADALDRALLDVRRTYGVAPSADAVAARSDKSVLVVSFPPGTPAEEITRKIREQLD